MIKRYIKKPIPIQAIQWDGTNVNEIMDFTRKQAYFVYHESTDNKITTDLYIKSIEGDMKAKVGDYIICGVRNEFYPCSKNIFEITYEEVE